MSADYEIHLRTPQGAKLAEITEWETLGYTKRRNAVGRCRWTMDLGNPKVALVADKCQVEVYRTNAALGVAKYLDWRGMVRIDDLDRTTRGVATFEALSDLERLRWRIVAWPAEREGYTQFTNKTGEEIMRNLVYYNCGAGAHPALGRDLLGIMSGTLGTITLADPFAGRGNVTSLACAEMNVLAALQEVAPRAGLDFELVKTDAATWGFRLFPGQLGQDRRSSVLFAIERGNLRVVKARRDATNEATAVIAKGKGEGAGRLVVAELAAGVQAGEQIEVLFDGGTYDTANALRAAARGRLAPATVTGEVEIIQAPNAAYGNQYGLGDLVRIDTLRGMEDHIVAGVAVEVKQDGETIDIDTERRS